MKRKPKVPKVYREVLRQKALAERPPAELPATLLPWSPTPRDPWGGVKR